MFTLPIYFQQTKAKTVLVSMNAYRNWHYHTQNQFKTVFTDLLKPQLKGLNTHSSKYCVKYVLYYKNPTCDLTNVCSLISKVFNDVLQAEGLVINDNVQWLKRETFEVGGQDKINPRVEIHCKKY